MEEKDLRTAPSVIFDRFPLPTGLRHRSQITEGPVLRPFSYTRVLKPGGNIAILS